MDAPVPEIPEILSQQVLVLVVQSNVVISGGRTVPFLIVDLVTPPQSGASNEGDGVASEVDGVPLYVPRRPLCTIYLSRYRAADISD